MSVPTLSHWQRVFIFTEVLCLDRCVRKLRGSGCFWGVGQTLGSLAKSIWKQETIAPSSPKRFSPQTRLRFPSPHRPPAGDASHLVALGRRRRRHTLGEPWLRRGKSFSAGPSNSGWARRRQNFGSVQTKKIKLTESLPWKMHIEIQKRKHLVAMLSQQFGGFRSFSRVLLKFWKPRKVAAAQDHFLPLPLAREAGACFILFWCSHPCPRWEIIVCNLLWPF